MENFLQKLYLKLINFWKNDIYPKWYIYWIQILIYFKVTDKNKKEMYFLINKNYHYGFLIETIILKLKLMKESWPIYKYNENELEILDILIKKGEELLNILEQEDCINHLRSKEYMKKQKQFFDLLNYKLIELFY